MVGSQKIGKELRVLKSVSVGTVTTEGASEDRHSLRRGRMINIHDKLLLFCCLYIYSSSNLGGALDATIIKENNQ